MELKLLLEFTVNPSGLLLIVPYGIETAHRHPEIRYGNPFNRTLWN